MTQAGTSSVPIAIIGAGFAGIGTAIRLLQSGFDSFVMFERADEVGGTWRDNTYPGCACDVASHVYSLSFEQKPDWGRRFAPWYEIQDYLVGLVEKYELRERIRFNTEIVDARFDENTGTWTLTTSDGDKVIARAVVSGVGGLVDPAYPEIEGIDRFEGPVFHTARWNHDVDLKDKRVAVVGTGASAVQVVPSIASLVTALMVFQRTASWVVPKFDLAYSAGWKRFLTRFPFFLRVSRFLKYWLSELLGPIVFLDSKILSWIGERISKWHLKKQVADPELREKLWPSIQFGCKRVLVSDEYWETFDRDNVELVTDAITRFTERGVETADGTVREADAIVLATGFQLGITNAPFRIVGLNGRTLDDAWADGAVAYKGVTVSGFPNWFMIMGPNTGPGHTSVLVYSEAQMNHALTAIRKILVEGAKYIDVRQEVMDRYNEGIQGRMKYMVWGSGCKSWYLSPDGSNHSLYPGFAAEYVLRTRRLDLDDYELTPGEPALTPSEQPSPAE